MKLEDMSKEELIEYVSKLHNGLVRMVETVIMMQKFEDKLVSKFEHLKLIVNNIIVNALQSENLSEKDRSKLVEFFGYKQSLLKGK